MVNASVYGYSSYQGRLCLERFRNFQPDLVLISFGGNDAGPNFASDRALPRPSAWDRFLDRWSSRLRVMALVRYAAYRLADRSGAPRSVEATSVPRVSVEEYRENLRAMIDQSRRMGARPVLFTRPFAYDEYAAGRKSSLRGYYQATLDVGAAEKVSVVDLHRMMGCHWSLYQDHAHFNARGHAVAASLVAQALLAVLTRGTYDVDVVRYRPEDGPYESLLDQLRTKVHLWVAEPQARLALREAAGGRSLHTLFDLASPPPSPTWRLANATDSLEMGVGRLCVTSSSGSPALVPDVPPDPDGYLSCGWSWTATWRWEYRCTGTRAQVSRRTTPPPRRFRSPSLSVPIASRTCSPEACAEFGSILAPRCRRDPFACAISGWNESGRTIRVTRSQPPLANAA